MYFLVVMDNLEGEGVLLSLEDFWPYARCVKGSEREIRRKKDRGAITTEEAWRANVKPTEPPGAMDMASSHLTPQAAGRPAPMAKAEPMLSRAGMDAPTGTPGLYLNTVRTRGFCA